FGVFFPTSAFSMLWVFVFTFFFSWHKEVLYWIGKFLSRSYGTGYLKINCFISAAIFLRFLLDAIFALYSFTCSCRLDLSSEIVNPSTSCIALSIQSA